MARLAAHAGTLIFRVQGQRLLAGFHRPSGPEGKRFPTVLFLHGFPGSEKSIDVQRTLLARGIASVAPSFLGSWGSGGVYRFSTLVAQAQAALRATRKLYFVDPGRIAVYGFSMGGWTALNLAASIAKIRGVVAVAPCGGPEMISSSTSAFLAHLSRPLNVPPLPQLRTDFVRALERFDPAHAVPRIKAPLLIVHGDRDETIPLSISRRLESLAPQGARLVVVHGADHGFLEQRAQLVRLTANFLELKLK